MAGNSIPLQRCHIVPRSLGGANDASNVFLLCRECHDLAPNTSFPDVFFEWARAQSSHTREASKVQAAFESFGVDTTAREELYQLMTSSEFKSWVSDKFGLHRPQSQYAPVSSRLTPATMVGLAVYYWQMHRAPS